MADPPPCPPRNHDAPHPPHKCNF
ncbi:protein of unknown function [Azospirillum baldaniorum]|uniref:Uncharacterized protein n=1 Tax=Azospirillum baldaniorum TaxID=1064539 RepID=A0A9P1JT22_9PROT|nr:protein of unknown function [Azospirillum baldaniorum]